MTDTDQKNIAAVLEFWLTETPPEKHYVKDPEFDKEISERFGAMIEAALRGAYDRWAESRSGLLALIILLDQMTRNVFRDTPKSFAGDAKALALSLQAQKRGDLDAEQDKTRRHFLLMPMMHSEDIAIQEASLPLFKKYSGDEYAIKHRDIIARFGRFPHRNAILGRESTEEEKEFLKEPGSSF